MKRLSNLLAALVFASLVIFMSCGGGESDPPIDPLQDEVDNLTVAGGWSAPSNVTTDGGTPDGDWSSFSLTFTGSTSGGSYSVSNVPDGFGDVWSSGSWVFGNDSGTVITKTQNGVETDMTASISGSQLTLQFDVAEPTARTNGIAGTWVFTFNL